MKFRTNQLPLSKKNGKNLFFCVVIDLVDETNES